MSLLYYSLVWTDKQLSVLLTLQWTRTTVTMVTKHQMYLQFLNMNNENGPSVFCLTKTGLRSKNYISDMSKEMNKYFLPKQQVRTQTGATMNTAWNHWWWLDIMWLSCHMTVWSMVVCCSCSLEVWPLNMISVIGLNENSAIILTTSTEAGCEQEITFQWALKLKRCLNREISDFL